VLTRKTARGTLYLKENKYKEDDIMYYRAPGNAVCADVIPYYENGTYYLFYLRDYRDFEKHGEGCPWCLLTTTDLVHYVDHGEVLLRGAENEQDLYVFTGSCIKYNGEYYIYYTGHNPHKAAQGVPMEKILLAKSSDLYHWDKVRDFQLAAPEAYEMHDYRDPFVYYDGEKQKYCMLLVGRVKQDLPENSKGVTLILYSEDMLNWSEPEIFYAPNAFHTHECPDLFKMGDWWYLAFSEYSDRVLTTYRMSRSPAGPWITPKVYSFDGHAFYAAKSASDGNRRIMFGWNPLKDQEKDNRSWIWGGTIIPHELVQAEDGTLYAKCPEEIKAAYGTKCSIVESYRMGDVMVSAGTITLGTSAGKSVYLFEQMPKNCRIELDFTVCDDVGDFGVLLRTSERADQYYAVKLEPKYNRMAFDKLPRINGTAHVQVDTERYCPVIPGQKHHMTLIVEDNVCETYVDDRVAMSARMFDRREGCLGLFAQNTSVKFENISVYTGEE